MVLRHNSCWFLLGCTTLLMVMVQPAAAAAVAARPTSTPGNRTLRGTIDIPSESSWREETREAVYQPHRALTHHTRTRTGYDRDFTEKNRMVLKRSEKTMQEYKRYMAHNCREIAEQETLETFFNWEQHQFARHLKSSVRTLNGGPVEASEEKKRLRALLTPDKNPLKSLCKWTLRDYGERQLLRDHRFEDYLVDINFFLHTHIVNRTYIGDTGMAFVSYWPRPQNVTKKVQKTETDGDGVCADRFWLCRGHCGWASDDAIYEDCSAWPI